ncbi:peptidoglycan/LPS O-acetylase OafA/YrhL [Microbacterium endophyticum]|uniref:Peptidoglycan/LPS O-acetylase OafA/YrhL n=1 Tax=Microbacterium endophyticum TaxID=1526412 RepID=A0A7W4V4X0_9MICO|nr:acyltransferase family protein [Microbacterium endophyticum]MBB2976340.1 peptidoglycan/LPS O-acetylase OafA/YrhL [Microbacterium endophyticum]NIK35220.1 peptidoglycan/LPS O-acetylase OafA/YrhL [Microbacterium endophyticum]
MSAVLPSEMKASSRKSFRPEIQGLRALAVGAVLIYHLWPNRVSGGFVGVDVFFVISGFLITSHLLSELNTAGRISVGRFWSRRAKRLLPDALLVLALTGIAILIWVPRTLWQQFLTEVAASTLYVQNWLLAANSVDYSAADNGASPVQHFWTLSVEEQFYIALPLLLIAFVFAIRRFRWNRSIAIYSFLGAITLLSFFYSIWLTHWSESEAYFSTLTRVWEFGVGALIPVLPRLKNAVAKRFITLVGLASIGIAIGFFSESTPFPGSAAALPVLGTALVIWAGSDTFASALGKFTLIAFLGRISYAVYLWHWPPIILLPYITQHPLTTIEKLLIIVGAIAMGAAATLLWEDRVRFSPRLLGRARPRTIAAVSAIGMAIVLALPAAGALIVRQENAHFEEVTRAIEAGTSPCLGAASLAEPGCVNPDLDGILVPNLTEVTDDNDNRSECWSTGGDPTFNSCTLGPASGFDKHLLVVGDSHSNALLGAYELIAQENNWRIDVAGRAGCYWTDVDLVQPTEALQDECAQWRDSLASFVGDNPDVDAIVTTKARRPLSAEVTTVDQDVAFSEVVNGMSSAWGKRPSLDVPVIALIDNPWLPADSLECVEQYGLDATDECSISRAEALKPDGLNEAAASDPNSYTVDLTDLYCGPENCSPVVGHVIVYRDGRHLTATYAKTIAPYLNEKLRDVLAASESR